ncbi:hypothetical protein Acor_62190 [Acrocarpospora corrugata]|uniref:Resolvase/invertase-type recombinase catalytic domain-containing protein n=1 Tax=Acrocarpospora corrugata TaxID=35763 RepID=A0A5M3W839_9ACTN|nr:hypothetical protein Acor_62190 [Acrocarpospora corrugata]
MPVPVVKTATGRYLVLEQAADGQGRTVAYCRVSSADQKGDLERQAGRVVTAATGMGIDDRRSRDRGRLRPERQAGEAGPPAG